MKKLLLSSITLFLFSSSILLFQISCQKEANAGPNPKQSLNKIVYIKEIDVAPDRTELWISNIDGSNQNIIPVTFAFDFQFGSISLSPDGTKVIFSVVNDRSRDGYIYSCNIDGTNLTKLIEHTGTNKAYYYSVNTQ